MAIEDTDNFLPIYKSVQESELVLVSCYVPCAQAIWLAEMAKGANNAGSTSPVIAKLIDNAYRAGRP